MPPATSRQCLPDELSPFAAQLLQSGEALAYLHLSGNHCTSKVDDNQIGSVHTYQVALRHDQPEGDKFAFEYEVLGVFDSYIGKCVVYAPLHAPERTVIAFRGVRIDVNMKEGNASDVSSMLERRMTRVTWLPSKARMSIGICRHAGAIWGGTPGRAHLGGHTTSHGLVEFLRTRLRPESEVHFTGLSLAGSLAQLMALRCCLDASIPIADGAHVLTFGALPFMNAETASVYDATLGARCAHLATRLLERMSPAATIRAATSPWWIEADDDDDDAAEKVYAALDPLTLSFMTEPKQPAHTYAIESEQRRASTDCGDGFSIYSAHPFWSKPDDPDGGGAARLRAVREWPTDVILRSRLHQLMLNQLDDTDGLHIDFLRLHRGKAYKTAVLALVNSAIETQQAQRASERAAGESERAGEPAAAPTAPTGGVGMRKTSSKRALSEMLGDDAEVDAAEVDAATEPLGQRAEAAAPATSSETGGMRRTSSKRALSEMLAQDAEVDGGDENQPVPQTQRDGLSKLASHGSMADRLDEIAMF